MGIRAMQMRLKNIALDSVSYKLNHYFNIEPNEGKGLDFKIVLDDSFDSEQNILSVGIRVHTDSLDENRNNPFEFDVHIFGIFDFDKKPEQKTIDQFKNINCPAILFPYIRETISDIVRRSGLPPIFLPPVNFIEMNRAIQKNNENDSAD